MRRPYVPYLICLISLLISAGCLDQSDRKIKLSDERNDNVRVQAVSSVLQVKEEQQHIIAILPFDNRTEDESLDWLRRGLADMLTAELSQSSYLNVIPISYLYEDLHNGDGDFLLAKAKKSQVETVLSGAFDKSGDDLSIEIELLDVASGDIIKSEIVQGESLEQIFFMVDNLSARLRANLRGELEATKEKALSLAKMTESVEAFKCYSEALKNMAEFNYAEAEKCLQDAVAIDSAFAKAHLLLSKIKFRQKDFEAGNAALNQARKYAEKLSEPERLWLRLYEADRTGDVTSLIETMRDLLAYEPTDVQERMQLAEFLMQLGDHERVITEYEEILELDPSQKVAYNQLGYIYARRGDFATGTRYIDQYQALAPNEPNPYDSRGEILMMAGRFEDAREQFNLALEQRSDYPNSIMNLSKTHSELGHYDKAVRFATIMVENAETPVEKAIQLVHRALIHWRFDKIAEARRDLSEAQEIAPMQQYPVMAAVELNHALDNQKRALEIQKAYYTRTKKMLAENPVDPHILEGFVRFCLESDLPPDNHIPIVKRLFANEDRDLLKLQYELLLGILYLRKGDYAKAQEYCSEKRDDFFEVMTQFPNEARNKIWKYIIESISLEPKLEDEGKVDLTFVDTLFEVAQTKERKDLEVIAQLFYAQYHAKYGAERQLETIYQNVGTPLEHDWMVIGPFKNQAGFHQSFAPEKSIQLDQVYRNGNRTLSWQHVDDGAYDGYLDLSVDLQPSAWGVGYALVYINSPEKRKVQLRFASDEAGKIWLNDKLVWQVYRYYPVPLDHDIVSVYLYPGDNKLLVKTTNSTRDWGFYLRVTDDNGDGFADITFRSPDAEDPAVVQR